MLIARRRKRKNELLFWLLGAGFVLDRVLKYLFFQKNKVVVNEGLSWGIYQGELKAWFFGIFIVLLIVFYWKFKLRGFLFLLTGGVANLIDRIFCGGVVDYWKIWFLPILNVADLLITVGVFLLAFDLWRDSIARKRGKSLK